MNKKTLIFQVLATTLGVLTVGIYDTLAVSFSLYADEMKLTGGMRTIDFSERKNYENFLNFLKIRDRLALTSFEQIDYNKPETQPYKQVLMVMLGECYAPQRYDFFKNSVYVLNENVELRKSFSTVSDEKERRIQAMESSNQIVMYLKELQVGYRNQIIEGTRRIMQSMGTHNDYSVLDLIKLLDKQTTLCTREILGETRYLFVQDLHAVLCMVAVHYHQQAKDENSPPKCSMNEVADCINHITDPENRKCVVKGARSIMENLKTYNYSSVELINGLKLQAGNMNQFLGVVNRLFGSEKSRNLLDAKHINTLCTIGIDHLKSTVDELSGILSHFSPNEYSKVIGLTYAKDQEEKRALAKASLYLADVFQFVVNRSFWASFVLEKLVGYHDYVNLIDNIRDRITEHKSDCLLWFPWFTSEEERIKRDRKLRDDLHGLLQPAFPDLMK